MAITALSAGASGLSALSTQLDVTANNLANINTTGFKSFRTNLEDLAYEVRAQPGVENALGSPTPAGEIVGLGVRVSNTQQDFSQGQSVSTGRELDVMIDGGGFFQVELPPDLGGGEGYTRSGNFFINADGELVLGNRSGYRLAGGITISEDASKITISETGAVSETVGETTTQVGQIQLANFINPEGLQAIGGNVLIETEASGPVALANPQEPGLGSLQQGFLEGSNVDPVLELVDLIKTQRAFEFNSKSIQSADEALQVISNLRR